MQAREGRKQYKEAWTVVIPTINRNAHRLQDPKITNASTFIETDFKLA
jgi:hypothetical protein